MPDALSPKSILIISYTHSSMHGVGGRRWRKLSKALANRGHSLTYLSSEKDLPEDELLNGIQYLGFNSSYPKILDTNPKSLINKIQYRLALKKQLRSTNANPYDRASNDLKLIRNSLSAHFKSSPPDAIIISGAPFSLLSLSTTLKSTYPSAQIICDLRDPWTWGHGYGMQSLEPSRYKQEEHLELNSLSNCDLITLASEDIKKGLLDKYPQFDDKAEVLLNGLEPIRQSKTNLVKDNETLTVTHIGSINVGTSAYYEAFFESVASYSNKIKLRVIGNTNAEAERYLRQLDSANIESLSRMPEAQLTPHMQSSDAFVLFKKKGFENSYPSKFFDYIQYEKPILAFTKGGLVSDEIEKEQLGKVFNSQIESSILHATFDQIKAGQIKVTESYNSKKFSVSQTAIRLESLLD